jgi:hypothetical protein
MKWPERWVFPRGELPNFLIIAALSGALSFWLIGRQIYQASWGLIDDHDIFDFLGPGLHLAPSQIWHTMMTKTEIGTLAGRFRPTYYAVKLTETSLFGADVHLWYLANAVGFTVFLASLWWFMRRFVGIWLAGALTLYISLLRLWTGIWSRLGPSEIGGATCTGVMIFATYFVLFSGSARIRVLNAILLALATVALTGMKETFIPLAVGTFAVLVLAGIRKNLSLPMIAVLMLLVIAGVGGVAAVVQKQVLASGTDFYANPIGTWQVLQFAVRGYLVALLRTSWLFLIPILLFKVLRVIPPRPLRAWITDCWIAFGAYTFLVVTYALQCALYRSSFPLHSRYDFPAMLLVPLTVCILACETFYTMRPHFPEQTIDRAQLATAAALFLFTMGFAYVGKGPSLTAAVQTNIETTNAFYNELQLALHAAAKSPDSPIILEAYGPGAYEPVFSLPRYLTAFGARNRISVRSHPDTISYGKLYDGLQLALDQLEQAGGDGMVPLRESLAGHPEGCVSIAINGSPEPGCAGFQVKAL